MFLADVIRWRWRRGKGTLSHQDEGWTTLERWVYVYFLCVPCITDMLLRGVLLIYRCDGVLAILSFAPPLPSCLIFSSPLPLLFPLLFSLFLFHFLLHLLAPAGCWGYSLAMMIVIFCGVLSGGPLVGRIGEWRAIW